MTTENGSPDTPPENSQPPTIATTAPAAKPNPQQQAQSQANALARQEAFAVSARPSTEDEFRMMLEPQTFLQVGILAGHVVKSGMFRVKSIDDAIIRIMTGRALGLPMFAALKGIFSFDGNSGIESKLKVAICLKRSDCEYFYCEERSAKSCTWVAKRKGRPKEQRLTYTIEEARASGLLTYATPEKTAAAAWTRFPADMLVARASGKLADLVWPDASYGLPTREELEDERAITTTGETVVEPTTPPMAVPVRDFEAEADRIKARIVAANAKGPDERKALRAEVIAFLADAPGDIADGVKRFYSMGAGAGETAGAQ